MNYTHTYKCGICGKITRRIDYHSETYKSPEEGLFPICQGYNTRWYNRSRFPIAFQQFIYQYTLFDKINNEMKESLIKENYIIN